jgi:hypothetical protein
MKEGENNFRIEIYKLNVSFACADPKTGKSEKHTEEISRQMPLGKSFFDAFYIYFI